MANGRLEPDRIEPRAEGGNYDPSNIVWRTPLEHAQVEGRIRIRSESIDRIKTSYDDYKKLIQTRNAMGNKLFAWSEGLDPASEAVPFITEMHGSLEKKIKEADKKIKKLVKDSDEPITRIASSVSGVGHITIAAMLSYIVMEKAPNPSSLWSYVGLDVPAHLRKSKDKSYQKGIMDKRKERGHEFYCTGEDCGFCKGEKSRLINKDGLPMGYGGCQALRTQLYTAAESWVKNRNSAYRAEYDKVKTRLGDSEKETQSRKTGKTGTHANAWRDAPKGHRHGAAMRAAIKLFLFDWWWVSRTLAGEPTRLPYAIEKLGHTGFSPSFTRGWII